MKRENGDGATKIFRVFARCCIIPNDSMMGTNGGQYWRFKTG